VFFLFSIFELNKSTVKSLTVTFILSLALCINVSAQKWLWAREGVDSNLNDICQPTAIATDKAGNVYEAGVYDGTISFGSFKVRTNYLNTRNFFLTKYASNGTVVWANNAVVPSNNSSGFPYGVVTDKTGNIYLTGVYEDTITFGTYTLVSVGGAGMFLVKYSPNGNVVWAKSSILLGEKSNAFGLSVTTDSAGYLYVTGHYGGSINFGSFVLANGYTENMFLAKCDTNGNVLWLKGAQLASSTCQSRGYDVATDKNCNVYVCGQLADTVAFGAYSLYTKFFSTTAFLAKYDSSGNVIWVTAPTNLNVGMEGACFALTDIVDKSGNVYVSGQIQDSVMFGPYKLTTYGTNGNVFLAKYNASGNIMWVESATPVSSTCSAIGSSLAIDRRDNIYLTGCFDKAMNLGGVTFNSDSLLPTYLLKLDTNGVGLCGTFVNNFNNISYVTNLVAPDPIKNEVYLIGSFSAVWWHQPDSCAFGDTTLFASGVAGYLAKWTCGCYAPIINTNNDTVIQFGQTIQLKSSGGATYYWNPSAWLSCDSCPNPIASPTVTTTYVVAVTDSDGCSAQKTVTIDVVCGNVFVPDAFSPNGDGANEVLYVRGDCIKTMDFIVYDRWGNKMFESNNPSIGWDGTYKGQPMNTGTYVYLLNAEMYNGTNYSKKGNVALVR